MFGDSLDWLTYEHGQSFPFLTKFFVFFLPTITGPLTLPFGHNSAASAVGSIESINTTDFKNFMLSLFTMIFCEGLRWWWRSLSPKKQSAISDSKKFEWNLRNCNISFIRGTQNRNWNESVKVLFTCKLLMKITPLAGHKTNWHYLSHSRFFLWH